MDVVLSPGEGSVGDHARKMTNVTGFALMR